MGISTPTASNETSASTEDAIAPDERSGVVAIVGRPNVGKSTLFNRLCNHREALVHNEPGLTRDRRYGVASRIGQGVSLIDTGGLLDASDLGEAIAEQSSIAIDEADLVMFLLEAREGLTPGDEEIASDLRQRGVPVLPVLNKVDGVQLAHQLAIVAETAALGFGEPMVVSASHNRGIDQLASSVTDRLPRRKLERNAIDVTVAVVGRPNVGKSTLVNAISGTDRCLVFDKPGTTRDSVQVDVDLPYRRMRLVDTAGVRRRGRVTASVEKFSIVQALAAMKSAQVSLLIVDATEGVVEQDLHLCSYATQAGSGIVLVVNKWDCPSSEEKRRIRNELARRFRFAPWISVRYTSALTKSGLSGVLAEVNRVHATGRFEVTTAELNRALSNAVEDHAPPAVRGRTIRLRYANKVGTFPPAILIHGNQTESLTSSYVRYLENRFRQAFGLSGMPVKIAFRSTSNPFKHLRNRLTPRQLARRRRLIRHRKNSRRA
ncbi:MAG: ribosome biogenesis GTPase Der [Pseudomonadales bacterium]|nr:ribosome biogenesis GTPase Der [Pseudomonadales bacterium]